jgi:N-acyl-D-aspartate/D-glutamate deacylase
VFGAQPGEQVEDLGGVADDHAGVGPFDRADLVAFDPGTVGTTPIERVTDQPGGADRLIVRSTGVEHMWVNGAAVRRGGEDIPWAAAGRLLRS